MQTQYHTLIEIIYTVVPILIVLGLFVFTVLVENKVRRWSPTRPPSGPRLRLPVGLGVRVSQRRQDHRPDHATPRPWWSPPGRRCSITSTSLDVLHGFYVPEFNFSRYASPGYTTSFDFNVLHDGVYRGQCTQLCGLYHSLMFFNVRAVSPSSTRRGSGSRAPTSRRTPLDRPAPGRPARQRQRDRAQLLWRDRPTATRQRELRDTQEVRSTVTDVIAPPGTSTSRPSSTSRPACRATATRPTPVATRTTARPGSSSG